MSGERRGPHSSTGEKVTSRGLAGVERVMDDAGEQMLRQAPKATRLVLRQVGGLPGKAYDVVEVARAKPEDLGREALSTLMPISRYHRAIGR